MGSDSRLHALLSWLRLRLRAGSITNSSGEFASDDEFRIDSRLALRAMAVVKGDVVVRFFHPPEIALVAIIS